MERRGIIAVSSGTSDEEAIELSIKAVEDRIRNHFNTWEIRRAFTSEAIIKKVRNKLDIKIDTVEEALTKMIDEEFSYVIVQPLNLIPGSEYEKTIEVVKKYKSQFKEIKLGRPVLYYDEDFKKAAEALKNQIPTMNKDMSVILVGHGTKHNANIYYKRLQDAICHERLKVYVATLSEHPCIYDIIQELKRNNIKEVILMPYMLVCGRHGKRDIAGDKEDSCKSILEKEGFKVSLYLHGIGENEKYQEIYLDHIKDAIEA
jgi:sirohydrochlorin cobaltochelatase